MCKDVNTSAVVNPWAEDEELRRGVNNIRDLFFIAAIPIAPLGIFLNNLCLTFFLRHQRKGIGNKLVIMLNCVNYWGCLLVPISLIIPLDEGGTNVFWRFVITIIVYCTMAWKGIITMALWAVRMWAILFPLRRIKPRVVWSTMAVVISICHVAMGAYMKTVVYPYLKTLFCGVQDVTEIEYINKNVKNNLYSNIGACISIPSVLGITFLAIRRLKQRMITSSDSCVGNLKQRAIITVLYLLIIQLFNMLPQPFLNLYFHLVRSRNQDQIVEKDYSMQVVGFLYSLNLANTATADALVYLIRNEALNKWVRKLGRSSGVERWSTRSTKKNTPRSERDKV